MSFIGKIEISDIQAEQSVLGAVFLDQKSLDSIGFLEARDFSNIRHQKIFEVMRYLHRDNKPVDIVTVTSEYLNYGRIDDSGGAAYLTELARSCPTAANVTYYAEIVRSKALRRRGTEAGMKISNLYSEDFTSDEEYFAAIESIVSELRPQGLRKMMGFAESEEDYFAHLTTPAEFILTGFKNFDEWAKGLWRGWLYVLAGRPSAGKTAKLLQFLYGIARQHRNGKAHMDAGAVLLWSQEMGREQIYDRWMAMTTGVNYNRIKSKNLDFEELGKIRQRYETLKKYPLFVQDSAGVTIDEIRSTARLFKRQYGKIGAIAVDYLQIMSIPQKRGETRSDAIGKVTRAAKQLARELDCVFILLSQMTRDSENASKPQLSHLKESGSIEQDADVVEFLWHDPEDTDTSGGKVVQSFIAKGRDIGVNEFRLLFKGWMQRFEELPPKERDFGNAKNRKR
ncbi:DnaB-like helicase C-terminal domain-containing protein [Brevibacillus centrosporus]|uniref:replicative DNA helicase n=1 Tax=Brevibacillus centrosporus TaxID=54910 RepID=UPI000F0A2D6E|nr:DnaB-like helicase C-terminal domain-containing protein [Brevibacillus centrosporus]MEC2133447.1 DnaB-like helicase C-terminal domain-containing protein [Brevibacillus centrosporus]RNB63164.1 replicative DNA helicase [Brevibacillus centrosporus]GED35048.1 replicative DNA helicase [Brevibacillus centrosporus]